MCGIFGTIGIRELDKLESCARTLHHRGPDAFGDYFDAQSYIYLAHCRLSIIDLSDRGRQPMATSDGRFQLVFNGEIYNYRQLRRELETLGRTFCSDTDTEVILQAYEVWGRACLDRLIGMFAFALWDRDTRQLFLARDRLGIKPLYVARWGHQFAFASEAKALLDLPGWQRQIHPHGLLTYLLYGYVIGRQSIWDGIERLPPGQWLQKDLTTGAETGGAYWKLEPKIRNWSVDDAVGRLHELLEQIATDHLIADVPVGLFLSGGLDSGLLAAHISRRHPEIGTYSMGFAGWENNELADAAEIAAHVNLANRPQILKPRDFLQVEQTFDAFDEPLGDTAIFPTKAISAATRPYIKVALSGDGGDELFGGYRWYVQLESDRVRRQASFWMERLRRMFGVGRSFPSGFAGRMEYHRFLTSPSFACREITALFPWIRPDQCQAALEVMAQSFRVADERYKRWQELDVATYLVDNNLVRVDRASMAHSLEVRVPFCDHRLAEFAFSLPDGLCVVGDETKVLLRRAAQDRLPARIAARRKQGFSFPLTRLWPAEQMIKEIRTGALVQEEVICSRALERLLQEPQTGNWPYKVWTLAALEYWCRRWWRGTRR